MAVRVHSVYDSPGYRTRKVTKLLRPYKSSISKKRGEVLHIFLNVRVYPAQKARMHSWRSHISISEKSET
jgi:hypothetical protein